MAEFDLNDLEKINNQKEVLNFLIDKKIIKQKKFLEQLKYERELDRLNKLLLQLQTHIIENKKRLLVIFEGRDAAGKGGTIKRVIEKLNPKKYKVAALPVPTDLERGQWYFQRYFQHLPNQGEIVFFDRSWYNRAVVEPVFGFCTDEQHELFLTQVKHIEKLIQDDGIILVKIFLTISKNEQFERLEDRKNNPQKKWKVGGLDLQAQEKWKNYSHYIEKMFKKTASKNAPWFEIVTDSKKIARVEAMKKILSVFNNELSTKEESNDKVVITHW